MSVEERKDRLASLRDERRKLLLEMKHVEALIRYEADAIRLLESEHALQPA